MANTEILNRKDPLTGFHTKEGLNEYLTSRLNAIYDNPKSLSVIMLDLDSFKGINDKYGHLTGDDALRFFARVINTALKGQHFVARYGGDEFVIVMPDSNNCRESTEIANRIRMGLQKDKFVTPTGTIRINTSIGIGNYPRDAKTPRELIEMADQALYYAKKHGKNRVIHSRGLKSTFAIDKIFLGIKTVLVLCVILVLIITFGSTGSLRGVALYCGRIGYYGQFKYNQLFKRYNYCSVELKRAREIQGWIIEDKANYLVLSPIKPALKLTSLGSATVFQPIKIPRTFILAVSKSLKD